MDKRNYIGFDLTTEMFKRTFLSLQIDYLVVISSKSLDVGNAYNDQEAMESGEFLKQNLK